MPYSFDAKGHPIPNGIDTPTTGFNPSLINFKADGTPVEDKPISSGFNPTNVGGDTFNQAMPRLEASLASNPADAADFLNSKYGSPNTFFNTDKDNNILYTKDSGKSWNKFDSSVMDPSTWSLKGIPSALAQDTPDLVEMGATGLGAAASGGLGAAGAAMGVNGLKQIAGSALGISPIDLTSKNPYVELGAHGALALGGEFGGEMLKKFGTPLVKPLISEAAETNIPVASYLMKKLDSLTNGADRTGFIRKMDTPSENFPTIGPAVESFAPSQFGNSVKSNNNNFIKQTLNSLDSNITNPDSVIPEGSSSSDISLGMKNAAKNDTSEFIKMMNQSMKPDSDAFLEDADINKITKQFNSIIPALQDKLAQGSDSGYNALNVTRRFPDILDLLDKNSGDVLKYNPPETTNLLQRGLAAQLKEKILNPETGDVSYPKLQQYINNPQKFDFLQRLLKVDLTNGTDIPTNAINDLSDVGTIANNSKLHPTAPSQFAQNVDKVVGAIPGGKMIKGALTGLKVVPQIATSLATQPFYNPLGMASRSVSQTLADKLSQKLDK